MRISNLTIFDALKYRLARTNEDLFKMNEVVSTGKRINTLSDDPVGLVQVLDLRSSLSNLGQLERNIATGRMWLDTGETALDSVREIITDTKVMAIRMANGSLSASDRRDAAKLVEGTLKQLVALGNTTVNGEYIFSGTKTDTNPFEMDDPDHPAAVTYSGNATPFQVKIGKDLVVEVGHDGQAILGDGSTQGVFKTLLDLRDRLEADDVSGIEQSISALDSDLNHIVSVISEIGIKGVRLDTKQKIIEDLKLSYEGKKSAIEDADMVQAISELKLKETAYQAALNSSAKVMQMSLVDFL